MNLKKSVSLPQINLNKYQNFFTKKNLTKTDLALQQGQPQQHKPTKMQLATTAKKKTHLKNLQLISQRSSLQSKVETYLIDNRKMGILDHATNETMNRRSLAKISMQIRKPTFTAIDQQYSYLKQIKREINDFCELSRQGQQELKNIQAVIGQTRQKIAYYDEILKRDLSDRIQLLRQRQENIFYIRYETQCVLYLQNRLKQINIVMKARVKEAQQKVKNAEFNSRNMNQKQGINQQQLNNRIYYQNLYSQFQYKKSQDLGYFSQKAMHSMQVRQAATSLKKHQQGIVIMNRDNYEQIIYQEGHEKILQMIQVHKFYRKIMDSSWSRAMKKYAQYQKAKETMTTYAIDRTKSMPQSFKFSQEMKKQLRQRIQQGQNKLNMLQAKNKQLHAQYSQFFFKQIPQIQEILSKNSIDIQTGRESQKDIKNAQQRAAHKAIQQRQQNIGKSKTTLTNLRQWVRIKQKDLGLAVSKRESLDAQFISLINYLKEELKNIHQKKQKGKQESKQSMNIRTTQNNSSPSKSAYNKNAHKATYKRK